MLKIFLRIKKNLKLKIIQGKGILLLKEPFRLLGKITKMIKLTMVIKTIPKNCKIEDLVQFTSLPSNNILQLHQFPYEIIRLLNIIKNSNPKTILEIGTLNGGTLFLFSRIVNEKALLISLDLPKYKFGHFQFDWRVPLIKRFSLKSQELKLIRANSHKTSTLNEVEKLLQGQKFDFIFIDADHSYDGVKADFEMYSPLVKEGGLIAFHDIVSTSVLLNNVHTFWDQIKKNFEFVEIIEDSNRKAGGIGILTK